MFKPRFAPMVKSGAKRQTVRPIPKRYPNVGDIESWREWSGKPYRSKQRELARVEIVGVYPISLTFRNGLDHVRLSPSKIGLLPQAIEDFARADGFTSAGEMFEWFNATHGLPFKGILIVAKDAQ